MDGIIILPPLVSRLMGSTFWRHSTIYGPWFEVYTVLRKMVPHPSKLSSPSWHLIYTLKSTDIHSKGPSIAWLGQDHLVGVVCDMTWTSHGNVIMAQNFFAVCGPLVQSYEIFLIGRSNILISFRKRGCPSSHRQEGENVTRIMGQFQCIWISE